jgi:hypothetical protein
VHYGCTMLCWIFACSLSPEHPTPVPPPLLPFNHFLSQRRARPLPPALPRYPLPAFPALPLPASPSDRFLAATVTTIIHRHSSPFIMGVTVASQHPTSTYASTYAASDIHLHRPTHPPVLPLSGMSGTVRQSYLQARGSQGAVRGRTYVGVGEKSQGV